MIEISNHLQDKQWGRLLTQFSLDLLDMFLLKQEDTLACLSNRHMSSYVLAGALDVSIASERHSTGLIINNTIINY